MDRFIDEEYSEYTDLATVESHRNDLLPEEFPEGHYDSAIVAESLGKSTPWRNDQRSSRRFSYENSTLPQDLDQHYPGDDHFIELPDAMDEP